IEQFNPQMIINTGSAGGFDPSLEIGDIVISSEVVHHDVDATGFDYAIGQVPQMPATYKADKTLIYKVKDILTDHGINNKIGLIGTGDSFMDNPEKINLMLKDFPSMLAAEMEGAAIAQVCYQYDIPFVIIRALSDIAGTDSPMAFQEFIKVAAKNAADLIMQMVKNEGRE